MKELIGLTHLDSNQSLSPDKLDLSPQSDDLRGRLSELELNSIELFVAVAHFLTLSKSIGEIYGLLFASLSPVPFEYIREKLRMSNGSASQGLRLLRSINAVKAIYVPGDRRDHYVVETGLARIAAGFLREKIAPNLVSQQERFARLLSLLSEIQPSHRAVMEERIQSLQSWRRQARAILPKVMQGLRASEQVAIKP